MSVAATTVRPLLRWTNVTGPDGRARMEMRWDAAAPAPAPVSAPMPVSVPVPAPRRALAVNA